MFAGGTGDVDRERELQLLISRAHGFAISTKPDQ